MTIDKSSAIPQVYQPGMAWEDLERDADEILGYELARDELADDLVGVPFMLTAIAFRPGVMRDKVRQAYVSCEVLIGPKMDLRHINNLRASSELNRLTDLDGLAFGPGDHVVFNDGSTGVYRQCVQYLTAKGYIQLAPPVIEAGVYGVSSFDQPPEQWANIIRGNEYQKDGFTGYSTGLAPALYCPRGLRLSLYSNEYTQTGRTRYLG